MEILGTGQETNNATTFGQPLQLYKLQNARAPDRYVLSAGTIPVTNISEDRIRQMMEELKVCSPMSVLLTLSVHGFCRASREIQNLRRSYAS